MMLDSRRHAFVIVALIVFYVLADTFVATFMEKVSTDVPNSHPVNSRYESSMTSTKISSDTNVLTRTSTSTYENEDTDAARRVGPPESLLPSPKALAKDFKRDFLLPVNELRDCCNYQGVCSMNCSCYNSQEGNDRCLPKEWFVPDRDALSCPNDCSNHGKCIEGKCYCDGSDNHDPEAKIERYFGVDCAVKGAPGQMLPSFIIMGTQRGGTSVLYKYLWEHPQILFSMQKELHYYDRQLPRNISIQQYLDWMQPRTKQNIPKIQSGKKIITGEGTPAYMAYCEIPRKIYSLFPHVKLLVILRDPVERIFSHNSMRIRKKAMLDKSFLTLLEQSDSEFNNACANFKTGEIQWKSPCCLTNDSSVLHISMVSRGYYAAQLRQIYRYFDKNQVLVLENSQLATDPQATLNRAWRFLEIDPFELDWIGKIPPTRTVVPDSSEKKLLTNFYHQANLDLFKLLGYDFDWI